MNTWSQTITIQNRFGLHMRPSAEISKLASDFDAIIAFHKGDRVAHAHSVVELLTLGAFHGDEIKVTSLGNDAKEALATVVRYLEDYSDDSSPKDIDSAAA